MEIFKYNQERVKKINIFMQKLLGNISSEEKVKLYREYEDEIANLNPLDIFYLDFYSNESDLSISKIKESANRFVNVFHKGIHKYADLGENPLFVELLKENRRIEKHLSGIKEYYKRETIINNRNELLQIFEKCHEFNLKFTKFQNIIFPNLENLVPSNKPLEVLWELEDDSRDLLKDILSLLNDKDSEVDNLVKKIGAYHYLVFGINQKEELILLPVMKQLLSEEKLNRIYNECIDIGFVFNEEKLIKTSLTLEVNDLKESYFTSKTGKINFKQLIAMLNHLPFDITFVDKDDFVLYYNESKERHFPRTPSVIGRLVKNCHPPKSVEIVEEIIRDFKNKRKDYEDFWIDFKGETLYIAYYAVRDEAGEYLGVLEVSQDISKFQKISGEKRLRDR